MDLHGVYNKFLYDHEKRGGALWAEWQLKAFWKVVIDCDFQDLPVQGSLFTWSRGTGSEMIDIRLDRVLANSAWLEHFAFSVEHHIANIWSDHLPIVIYASSV